MPIIIYTYIRSELGPDFSGGENLQLGQQPMLNGSLFSILVIRVARYERTLQRDNFNKIRTVYLI